MENSDLSEDDLKEIISKDIKDQKDIKAIKYDIKLAEIIAATKDIAKNTNISKEIGEFLTDSLSLLTAKDEPKLKELMAALKVGKMPPASGLPPQPAGLGAPQSPPPAPPLSSVAPPAPPPPPPKGLVAPPLPGGISATVLPGGSVPPPPSTTGGTVPPPLPGEYQQQYHQEHQMQSKN